MRSGRITGPVSIFLMGHFVALCAIRAWRTAFLIPVDATLSEVNTYKAFFGTISAMGGLILFACLSTVH